MKYQNIDALDARIEKIIKGTVKHYYTDWKNYDRPKYMGLKGSKKAEDRKIILIARECGTWLYSLDQIATNEPAATVYKYYYTQDRGDYYLIDLDRMEITRIDPEAYRDKITLA